MATKKQSALADAQQRLADAEQQSAVIGDSIAAVEVKLDKLRRKIQNPATRNETAVMQDQLGELRAAMIQAEETVDAAREERDGVQEGLWDAEFDTAKKRLAASIREYNALACDYAAACLDVEEHIRAINAIPSGEELQRLWSLYGQLPDEVDRLSLSLDEWRKQDNVLYQNKGGAVRATSQQGLIAHAIAQRILNG